MPHELEYIVDQAVCYCDKGAKPDFFKGTSNTTVKINGCKACTKADKIPIANIPSFGVCAVSGSACTPAPVEWTDTYKVKIKGNQTLLFKSKLPCSVGGKIEFMTSGQVPVSQEDLDELMEEHGEEEESDDGLSWWDAAEMIPFAGGVIGMVRSGSKGDWLGLGLSAASVVLDVGGLFSFGGGNVASAAVKGGKLARVGAKAIKAGSKVAKAGKVLKAGGKAAAIALAKKVDDIAMKTGKVCVFACFPAGTPIHTESVIKKIEDIKVGDRVWAFNEENGEMAIQEVTAIMQREVDATVFIELEGETIETTAEHPFYTENGWKDAADLTPDDKIQTKDKKWKSVKSQTFQYEKKKVYNFEVANWHTYFVGALAWLVHNAAVCLKGMWIKTSERMSEAAKRYQEFITGRLWDESYLLNGTKFDGVIDDVLIDAKSGYKNFVKNGRFRDWFKGKDDLIDQANRQLNAAEGNKIRWFFENEEAMQATQKIFKEEGIEGIELVFKPM